jgi:hypothetical protein
MRQLAERPRAVRFEMSAPLIYRCVGEAAWRKARTENVSRSGVLFEAALPVLPADTGIEFVMKLPGADVPGGAWVRCQGHIVRHGAASAAGGCAMAATIDAFQLLGGAPHGIPRDVDS